MSGGSWDYAYVKFEDVASTLLNERCPLRRALGEHLELIAYAMHEIEWVDSCDKSEPSDTDAIKNVFKNNNNSPILKTLINDGKALIVELEGLITLK